MMIIFDIPLILVCTFNVLLFFRFLFAKKSLLLGRFMFAGPVLQCQCWGVQMTMWRRWWCGLDVQMTWWRRWWYGPDVQMTWNNCDKCKLIRPFPDDLLPVMAFCPLSSIWGEYCSLRRRQVFLLVRHSHVWVAWSGVGELVTNDKSHTVMCHNGALIGGRGLAW